MAYYRDKSLQPFNNDDCCNQLHNKINLKDCFYENDSLRNKFHLLYYSNADYSNSLSNLNFKINLLKRYIEGAPSKIKRTIEFAKDVASKLSFVSEDVRHYSKHKKKFPFGEDLKLLLVDYVELEHDVLYHKENFSTEYQKVVEMRILRLLADILYDPHGVTKKLVDSPVEASIINSLFVLKSVKEEYRKSKGFIESLMIPLLRKLNIIHEITATTKNGVLKYDKIIQLSIAKKMCNYLRNRDCNEDSNDEEDETVEKILPIKAEVKVEVDEKPCLRNLESGPIDLDAEEESDKTSCNNRFNSGHCKLNRTTSNNNCDNEKLYSSAFANLKDFNMSESENHLKSISRVSKQVDNYNLNNHQRSAGIIDSKSSHPTSNNYLLCEDVGYQINLLKSKLLLLNRQGDAHMHFKLCDTTEILKSHIDGTPNSVRYTKEFVNEIYRILHYLYVNILRNQELLPFLSSRKLHVLLVRYVELEYEVLYNSDNFSTKYEELVESRILNLLSEVLYPPIDRKGDPEVHDPVDASAMNALYVLQNIKAEYKRKQPLVETMMMYLMRKLNVLNEANKLRCKSNESSMINLLQIPKFKMIQNYFERRNLDLDFVVSSSKVKDEQAILTPKNEYPHDPPSSSKAEDIIIDLDDDDEEDDCVVCLEPKIEEESSQIFDKIRNDQPEILILKDDSTKPQTVKDAVDLCFEISDSDEDTELQDDVQILNPLRQAEIVNSENVSLDPNLSNEKEDDILNLYACDDERDSNEVNAYMDNEENALCRSDETINCEDEFLNNAELCTASEPIEFSSNEGETSLSNTKSSQLEIENTEPIIDSIETSCTKPLPTENVQVTSEIFEYLLLTSNNVNESVNNASNIPDCEPSISKLGLALEETSAKVISEKLLGSALETTCEVEHSADGTGEVFNNIDSNASPFDKEVASLHQVQAQEVVEETDVSTCVQTEVVGEKENISSCSVQTIEVEQPSVEIEELAVEVEPQAVEVEERAVEVEEQAIEVEEQAVEVEEQAIEVEEQAVEVEEQAIEVEEQAVEIEEQTVEVEEQAVEIEEQAVEIEDQAVESGEQAVEIEEQAVEFEEEAVEVEEESVKAADVEESLQAAEVKRPSLETVEVGEESDNFLNITSKALESGDDSSNKPECQTQIEDACDDQDVIPEAKINYNKQDNNSLNILAHFASERQKISDSNDNLGKPKLQSKNRKSKVKTKKRKKKNAVVNSRITRSTGSRDKSEMNAIDHINLLPSSFTNSESLVTPPPNRVYLISKNFESNEESVDDTDMFPETCHSQHLTDMLSIKNVVFDEDTIEDTIDFICHKRKEIAKSPKVQIQDVPLAIKESEMQEAEFVIEESHPFYNEIPVTSEATKAIVEINQETLQVYKLEAEAQTGVSETAHQTMISKKLIPSSLNYDLNRGKIRKKKWFTYKNLNMLTVKYKFKHSNVCKAVKLNFKPRNKNMNNLELQSHEVIDSKLHSLQELAADNIVTTSIDCHEALNVAAGKDSTPTVQAIDDELILTEQVPVEEVTISNAVQNVEEETSTTDPLNDSNKPESHGVVEVPSPNLCTTIRHAEEVPFVNESAVDFIEAPQEAVCNVVVSNEMSPTQEALCSTVSVDDSEQQVITSQDDICIEEVVISEYPEVVVNEEIISNDLDVVSQEIITDSEEIDALKVVTCSDVLENLVSKKLENSPNSNKIVEQSVQHTQKECNNAVMPTLEKINPLVPSTVEQADYGCPTLTAYQTDNATERRAGSSEGKREIVTKAALKEFYNSCNPYIRLTRLSPRHEEQLIKKNLTKSKKVDIKTVKPDTTSEPNKNSKVTTNAPTKKLVESDIFSNALAEIDRSVRERRKMLTKKSPSQHEDRPASRSNSAAMRTGKSSSSESDEFDKSYKHKKELAKAKVTTSNFTLPKTEINEKPKLVKNANESASPTNNKGRQSRSPCKATEKSTESKSSKLNIKTDSNAAQIKSKPTVPIQCEAAQMEKRLRINDGEVRKNNQKVSESGKHLRSKSKEADFPKSKKTGEVKSSIAVQSKRVTKSLEVLHVEKRLRSQSKDFEVKKADELGQHSKSKSQESKVQRDKKPAEVESSIAAPSKILAKEPELPQMEKHLRSNRKEAEVHKVGELEDLKATQNKRTHDGRKQDVVQKEKHLRSMVKKADVQKDKKEAELKDSLAVQSKTVTKPSEVSKVEKRLRNTSKDVEVHKNDQTSDDLQKYSENKSKEMDKKSGEAVAKQSDVLQMEKRLRSGKEVQKDSQKAGEVAKRLRSTSKDAELHQDKGSYAAQNENPTERHLRSKSTEELKAKCDKKEKSKVLESQRKEKETLERGLIEDKKSKHTETEKSVGKLAVSSVQESVKASKRSGKETKLLTSNNRKASTHDVKSVVDSSLSKSSTVDTNTSITKEVNVINNINFNQTPNTSTECSNKVSLNVMNKTTTKIARRYSQIETSLEENSKPILNIPKKRRHTIDEKASELINYKPNSGPKYKVTECSTQNLLKSGSLASTIYEVETRKSGSMTHAVTRPEIEVPVARKGGKSCKIHEVAVLEARKSGSISSKIQDLLPDTTTSSVTSKIHEVTEPEARVTESTTQKAETTSANLPEARKSEGTTKQVHEAALPETNPAVHKNEHLLPMISDEVLPLAVEEINKEKAFYEFNRNTSNISTENNPHILPQGNEANVNLELEARNQDLTIGNSNFLHTLHEDRTKALELENNSIAASPEVVMNCDVFRNESEQVPLVNSTLLENIPAAQLFEEIVDNNDYLLNSQNFDDMKESENCMLQIGSETVDDGFIYFKGSDHNYYSEGDPLLSMPIHIKEISTSELDGEDNMIQYIPNPSETVMNKEVTTSLTKSSVNNPSAFQFIDPCLIENNLGNETSSTNQPTTCDSDFRPKQEVIVYSDNNSTSSSLEFVPEGNAVDAEFEQSEITTENMQELMNSVLTEMVNHTISNKMNASKSTTADTDLNNYRFIFQYPDSGSKPYTISTSFASHDTQASNSTINTLTSEQLQSALDQTDTIANCISKTLEFKPDFGNFISAPPSIINSNLNKKVIVEHIIPPLELNKASSCDKAFMPETKPITTNLLATTSSPPPTYSTMSQLDIYKKAQNLRKSKPLDSKPNLVDYLRRQSTRSQVLAPKPKDNKKEANPCASSSPVKSVKEIEKGENKIAVSSKKLDEKASVPKGLSLCIIDDMPPVNNASKNSKNENILEDPKSSARNTKEVTSYLDDLFKQDGVTPTMKFSKPAETQTKTSDVSSPNVQMSTGHDMFDKIKSRKRKTCDYTEPPSSPPRKHVNVNGKLQRKVDDVKGKRKVERSGDKDSRPENNKSFEGDFNKQKGASDLDSSASPKKRAKLDLNEPSSMDALFDRLRKEGNVNEVREDSVNDVTPNNKKDLIDLSKPSAMDAHFARLRKEGLVNEVKEVNNATPNYKEKLSVTSNFSVSLPSHDHLQTRTSSYEYDPQNPQSSTSNISMGNIFNTGSQRRNDKPKMIAVVTPIPSVVKKEPLPYPRSIHNRNEDYHGRRDGHHSSRDRPYYPGSSQSRYYSHSVRECRPAPESSSRRSEYQTDSNEKRYPPWYSKSNSELDWREKMKNAFPQQFNQDISFDCGKSDTPKSSR